MHLFAEMLRGNPLFQSPRVQACAGLVEAVVERLFTTVYLPGDTILRKGETSPWMGFIGTGGRVAVVLPPADETQQPKTLKILHEGDIIGELGLIFSARRSTDVRALVCVRVHVLSRDAFNAIKAQYPAAGRPPGDGDRQQPRQARPHERGRRAQAHEEADEAPLAPEARRRRPPLVRVTPLLPVPTATAPTPSAVDVPPTTRSLAPLCVTPVLSKLYYFFTSSCSSLTAGHRERSLKAPSAARAAPRFLRPSLLSRRALLRSSSGPRRAARRHVMAALLGDKVSPELEAEIAEEEKAIEHLVRSNAELEAHLKDAPDRELRAAVGENIVVIARKRAALQLKYDLRAKLEASAPIARSEARPPPPPAAASTEARAPPDGGVYL